MIEVLKQALEHGSFPQGSGIIHDLKKAIAELESQEPVTRYCCHSCFKTSGGVMLDRMIVCPDCGNKRCPKASNHALKCTNSNDPNQVGSIYTHPPQHTEQEPVSALWQHGETGRFRVTTPDSITDCDARWFKVGDLYTHPPQRTWIGLTHQQTKNCMQAWDGKDAYVLCRAIEATLKEQNNA